MEINRYSISATWWIVFAATARQREHDQFADLLNALLYVTEHGCKWRGLPKHLGNWHTIYTRMNRWSKGGRG